MATPDCRWAPKSRSRIRFSTLPSRASRMASSGVDALTRSAVGQRSRIHALIWAVASGESSATRIRSVSSAFRSRLPMALALPRPRRRGRPAARVVAAGRAVRSEPDDDGGAPAQRRLVLDSRPDLLRAPAHQGQPRVLPERAAARPTVVADAELDGAGSRRAHRDADERPPGVLARVADRLEHDPVEQDDLGGAAGRRLDGRVGDLGRAVERDVAPLAPALEVALGVAQAVADGLLESVGLEIARVEVVHDPAQLLGEGAEPRPRLRVVALVDGRGEIAGERVEDLVVDLLAHPDGLRLDVLEQ